MKTVLCLLVITVFCFAQLDTTDVYEMKSNKKGYSLTYTVKNLNRVTVSRWKEVYKISGDTLKLDSLKRSTIKQDSLVRGSITW
jgi:hypothetical protein